LAIVTALVREGATVIIKGRTEASVSAALSEILASVWHTDPGPGREIEVVTNRTRSRLAGFHEYQPARGSFLELLARLRRERIIPG
jgi:hypothetical protein